MNKKKAIPVYVFLALMVVVCAVYFAAQSGLLNPEEPAGVQGEQMESNVSRQTMSSIAEEDLPDMYRYVSKDDPLPKPDVFAEGYTATVNDFRITINDVYVAKDTQGLPYPVYLSESNGETVDENGTLTSAHSYLFMDITVENQRSLSRTFDICKNHPILFSGDVWLETQASNELATQSINNDADVKSRYQYMMQAEETVTYTVAYVFSDDDLERVTDIFLPIVISYPYRINNVQDNTWAWNPQVPILNLTPLWPGGGEKK